MTQYVSRYLSSIRSMLGQYISYHISSKRYTKLIYTLLNTIGLKNYFSSEVFFGGRGQLVFFGGRGSNFSKSTGSRATTSTILMSRPAIYLTLCTLIINYNIYILCRVQTIPFYLINFYGLGLEDVSGQVAALPVLLRLLHV